MNISSSSSVSGGGGLGGGISPPGKGGRGGATSVRNDNLFVIKFHSNNSVCLLAILQIILLQDKTLNNLCL